MYRIQLSIMDIKILVIINLATWIPHSNLCKQAKYFISVKVVKNPNNVFKL